MKGLLHTRRVWALAIACALTVSVGLTGCSLTDNNSSPVSSDQSTTQAPTRSKRFTLSSPKAISVMAVQNAHTATLMAQADVIGTAVTLTDDGRPALLVLYTSQSALDAAPAMIDGVPVKAVFTDKIVAMKGKPGGGGGGVDHKAKQTAPIQLGTSGGWTHDLANGFCCGGTLGSLISVGGQQRILSNYHVFESDIVSGGNNLVATTGDNIIQPGLIDVGCNAANAQNVATLVVTHSLPNNNVDCSSANVISGMVDPSGAILEIGTLSAATVPAFVGQAVKKSGRTTGLSRSSVSGLNATISVSYEDECAGNTAFTKTFTGQIVIGNKRSKFLDSGDSGSLMVEDATTNPHAVGLLFAGSRFDAIANPIDDVLNFLGASMVGN